MYGSAVDLGHGPRFMTYPILSSVRNYKDNPFYLWHYHMLFCVVGRQNEDDWPLACGGWGLSHGGKV